MDETMELTAEQTQELTELVNGANEKLLSAASRSAERAFGLGCSVGLIPVVLIAVVLYSLRIINLILAVLVGIMSVMFLIGVASLLSSIARANALKRTYQREVEPEFNRFTTQCGLPRRQLDTLASQVLPDDAPLQVFLKPLPPEPGVQTAADKSQVEK